VSASVSGVAALCALLGSASLAAGYALGGGVLWALPAVACGALWLAGQWRRWVWADAVGLVSGTALAAVGMVLGLGAGWMLAGLAGVLSAWDLAAFARWVKEVEPPEQARRLALRHAMRLLIVVAAGLALAGLALEARLRLSLPLLLLLGLVLVLGVSQAVRTLRRQAG
jgi:hypothetical protein